MGLKLKLKPFEKFVVNGVVIENGRHRNTVTLANHAQVMTGRSILQPEEASTPVKRCYYAVQAMLLDPANIVRHRLAYEPLMAALAGAIRDADMTRHLAEAASFVREGDYYKALAALRPVIAYEAVLLGEGEAPGPGPTAKPPAEASARV